VTDLQKAIDEQIGRNIECGEDGISIYKQIGILREALEILRSEVEKLSKKPVSIPELDVLTIKVDVEKGKASVHSEAKERGSLAR